MLTPDIADGGVAMTTLTDLLSNDPRFAWRFRGWPSLALKRRLNGWFPWFLMGAAAGAVMFGT